MATVLIRTLPALCLLVLLVVACNGGDDTGTPQGRPTLTDPASVPAAIPEEGREPFRLGGDRPLPPGSTEEPTVVPQRPADRTYTVQEGDTCGAIVANFNISVEVLIAANPRVNEDCTNLHVDEVLNIPAPDPSTSSSGAASGSDGGSGGGSTYLVVAGDTCAAIADDHGIPLQTFLVANGLDEESCQTLQIEQRVIIPE